MSKPAKEVLSMTGAAQHLFNMTQKMSMDYQPEKLHYFSLLHLQNFIPESPCNMIEDVHGPLFIRSLHMQIYDLYCALTYAEKEILPKFTLKNLHSITPEQICTWIRTINQHAAQTLLAVTGHKSGEYSTSLIERWNPGARFSKELQIIWLSGSREDLHRLFAEYQISDEVRDGYIDMIKVYLQDKTIEIPPAYIINRGKDDDQAECDFVDACLRSAIAYHRGLLSQNHLKALRSLVKICGFPQEIPGKMKAYATTLLEKMKACDPKDENAVCELVSWAFYESTEIHPFPNGNGRTSTIFGVDCVLQAFGYPDILMRTPAQREDPNSSYSIAIREIDNSREPLTAHIKGQLKMARDQTLRVSQRKMQLIRERVLLGLKLNFVLNNLAGNNVLNNETMAYCRSYVENDQRVAENRYIGLFVTRPRNPEKYLQRLQEIANISSQTVVWKRNVKTGMKFWVTGLTEQQTNDVAAQFNALAAEHKANIGKMDSSPTQGIIIWTNPPYIELKALSKACCAGIDSELATERAIAAELKK